ERWRRDQPQRRLLSYTYAKPGAGLPVTKPHLFDVEARKEVPVADDLFPNPWDVTRLRWEPDGRSFTFVYNQRGHQVLRVVGVDADTGKARAVVDERSKTFVDYAHKQFLYHLDETGYLLWLSE